MPASLWFVTPAWRRFELTRICLEQRRQACDQARAYGIDASCVVIADDENLDTARELGFQTVEQDNEWLGRKFNDGYAAAAAAGIDYVMAIGSDSWLDPVYLSVPLDPDRLLLSEALATVRADGRERIELMIQYVTKMGVAAIVPTAMYARRRFRPCHDKINKGCDTATWNRGLSPQAPREWHHHHPLEYVNFQSARVQVTDYQRIKTRFEHRAETTDAFAGLDDHYDPALVARVRRYYANGTDLHESAITTQ